MKTRNMTKTEKLMMTKVVTQYVYLLQTREFLNSKEPVYKIGRSKQDNYARFSQYGLGSVLLFQSSCYDSVKLEKEIIDLFNDKYERIKILGNEWFRGDADEMKADFCDIIKNSITTRKIRNNDTISILDAFVEVCLQQEMLQCLLEECTQQYLVEEDNTQNIVEKFIDEIIQDVFVEETIQDVIVEETIQEIIQDVIVEETIQEIIQDVFVEETIQDIFDEEKDDDDNTTDNNRNLGNKKFSCKTCDYTTNVKSNLQKHFLTKKYLLEVCPVVVDPTIPQKFKCAVCNKCYQSQSGLWKHSQVCKAPVVPEVALPIAPEIVDMDIHARFDNLERIILEMAKK